MKMFQGWIEKYHLGKWFRRDNFIILILAGILLIVIALPTQKPSDDTLTDISQPGQQNLWKEYEIENMGEETESNVKEQMSAEDYLEALEKKLENLISEINEVNKVHVMITLQESEELIVEKDYLEEQEKTIFETEGNYAVPYVIKTIFPKVEGVVVIVESMEKGDTKQVVTELVQALFDIALHKIKVIVSE